MDRSEKIVIIFTVMLIAIILVGVLIFSYKSCEARGRSFDGAEYGLIQGCMVKHNGRWLPLDNIRGFE